MIARAVTYTLLGIVAVVGGWVCLVVAWTEPVDRGRHRE